jgi:Tfp pilus assembly protein PilV
MSGRFERRDESGISLVEVLISMMLFAIVVVTVDASVTVVQSHQVQVSDRTQALDYLQDAQQAITRDLHAAQTWTTPAPPTSVPGSPVTATTLSFTADLGGGTPTISISLNTTTHVLLVTCTGAGCRSTGTGTITQAQISNVDSSSLFTFTTKEVTTTANSTTTNTFYYTTVSSTLILDTPKVGAEHVFQSTLSDPNVVINNAEFACQTALSATGASGSC